MAPRDDKRALPAHPRVLRPKAVPSRSRNGKPVASDSEFLGGTFRAKASTSRRLLDLPADGPASTPPLSPNERSAERRSWENRIELTPDRTVYQRFGKRALDVLAAGLALVALSPLFLFLILAIKIEDRGPVLYCSERVGRGGRCFRFLKFRSMVPSADSCRDGLQNLNEVDGPVFKIENDPRITRIGKVLRRTSMDELPQFWNVFRGDMTCVGPRPPIPSEVENYEPWQLERLSVRPGLTCLWQISGRSRIGFDEWMRLDMEYIHHHRSFSSDVRILLRTLPAVISGEGAY